MAKRPIRHCIERPAEGMPTQPERWNLVGPNRCDLRTYLGTKALTRPFFTGIHS
jgi:hypothetical protein